MDELLRLISLQDANTRTVLLGTTLLGIAAALVGSLAVLRKRSLVGDAVAHAALPGVCTAYLLLGDRNFAAFLVGALLSGMLAAAFIAGVRAFTRVKEDAAIALAIGGFFGVGIVLSRVVQNQPGGNRAGLDGFIFGKAASMVRDDAMLIAIVAGAVLGITLLLYKEFKLLCFDRAFADGLGWHTLWLDLLLMGLVCVCTVVGLPAVGVVLMVALLVIPGIAARFWTDRLAHMLLLASLFGGFSGFVGTVLSDTLPAPAGALSRGWPTGPVIVLVASTIFVVSLLCAPKRGLIADVVRRALLRRRIALHHILRDAYEALEHTSDLGGTWQASEVCRDATGSTLRRAMREGLIAETAGGFVLTHEGQREASRIVRAHRLWELFLIEQADIAADHVDRDADGIEHVLPASVIAQLELRLAQQGRLPASMLAVPTVPASPHPIEPATKASSRGGSRTAPKAWLALLLPTLIIGALACTEPVALASVAGEGASHDAPRAFLTTADWWTMATAVVCCVSCGVLGCYLVLRRMSLMGDAISHAILPGLALAFLFTGSRDPLPMLLGAASVGVLTALLSAGLSKWGKVPEDAAMGVVFTTLFAIGVVLITFVARQVDLDPGCVLYGLIELVAFDTRTIFGIAMPKAFIELSLLLLVILTLLSLFSKELRIVCFDPALATSMGISAALVHYGLMTMVAATSVLSFEAVGSILVIAMLVAPGATAQLLTDKLGRMLWWSAALAATSACLGYVLAVHWNTSVAGMIASVSLGMFLLACIAAPRYGVLGRLLRLRRAPTAASITRATP
jgi:manganese/zinc/iron transport system permease protein